MSKPVVLLVILTVIALVGLYGASMWGYRTSSLPYSFDVVVQEHAVWRILGRKAYRPFVENGISLAADPRIPEVVAETEASVVVEGSITAIDTSGEMLNAITLEQPDEEPWTTTHAYAVDHVELTDFTEQEGEFRQLSLPCSLRDISVGDWVTMEFLTNLEHGHQRSWVIHKLVAVRGVP